MKRRIRWLIGLAFIAIVFKWIAYGPFASMLEWQSVFLKKAFSVLLLSSSFCFYRIFRGPTAPDRAVAIDILGILIVGFCAILSIPTLRSWYIDIAIAWALQSFIGTLALAKYLEGRHFDE